MLHVCPGTLTYVLGQSRRSEEHGCSEIGEVHVGWRFEWVRSEGTGYGVCGMR